MDRDDFLVSSLRDILARHRPESDYALEPGKMGEDREHTPEILGEIPLSESAPAYLEGQLLIAMPAMLDPHFEESVIYVCAHSEQGAVGITINRPAQNITFPELVSELEIPVAKPPDDQLILIGGPVEMERGFVLHSTDYFAKDATLRTSETIGLTATLDILKAIARGGGPKDSLLAIGYSGWAPGQLESEIKANAWLNCDADPAIIFGSDVDRKWDLAIAKIGFDPGHLSSESGQA